MSQSKFKRCASALLLTVASLTPTVMAATLPPASGALWDAATGTDTLKSEPATVTTLLAAGNKAVQATFPGGNGYPALVFPVPAGGWNLAGFEGVQVDVLNKGADKAVVGLRVDNRGDWKKEPWNTESLPLAAGAAGTIKVSFGKSYGGNQGYALDPAAVSALKIYAINPKQDTVIEVSNLRVFGKVAAAASSNTTAVPASGRVELFDIATADATAFKTDGGASATIVEENGNKQVQAEFPAMQGYPSVDFPTRKEGWNLSAYAGVQVDITNRGDTKVMAALRVDNAGHWQKQPWNTESVRLAPGETKTLKVTFGKSYGGNRGYALDASKISNLKIFTENPKEPVKLLLCNLKPFGVAGTPAATPPATSASAVATENLTAPPISGELWTVDEKTNLATFKTSQSSLRIDTANGASALGVAFEAKANYPNVQFALPRGGWNLAAFAGVQVEVTNPNDRPVTAYLRADNPGDWRQQPWNTESLKIPAGQTKTLKLTFGQNNGAPGYALDAKRVTAMQLFIVNPQQDTTLLLRDLKAWGSAQDRQEGLTSPADREVPVTPAAWVGQRPPVEGKWVQTLNENFDGPALDEKLWSYNTWWDGLLKGQTQRYSRDNVILDNGVVKFKTEKRTGPQNDDPALPSRDYTAGHIITFDKWTQAYGYFEARVKLPTARGLWPAFWMMPDRGAAAGPEGWKRENTRDGGMEIDILEHLTEWGPGRNNVAAHWDGYDKDHQTWGSSNIYYGPTLDGWHTFGLLWEPGKLTWYIDGLKKAEFVNERVGSVPCYLLLNVQMGSWATKDVDDARLPDIWQVDYVRAWQLQDRLKAATP